MQLLIILLTHRETWYFTDFVFASHDVGGCRYATSMDHTENGDTAVLEEFIYAAAKG